MYTCTCVDAYVYAYAYVHAYTYMYTYTHTYGIIDFTPPIAFYANPGFVQWGRVCLLVYQDP